MRLAWHSLGVWLDSPHLYANISYYLRYSCRYGVVQILRGQVMGWAMPAAQNQYPLKWFNGVISAQPDPYLSGYSTVVIQKWDSSDLINLRSSVDRLPSEIQNSLFNKIFLAFEVLILISNNTSRSTSFRFLKSRFRVFAWEFLIRPQVQPGKLKC